MNFKPNDIIVPDALDYPNGALRVRSWDGKTLTAYPEGGGFVYAFDADAIEKHNFYVVDIELVTLKWRKSKFSLDCFDDAVFEGYHCGKLWNGWATPCFNLATIRKMKRMFDKWAEKYPDDTETIGIDEHGFENNKGSNVFLKHPDDDERYYLTPHKRDGEWYYSVGAYEWTWQEVTWDEEPEPTLPELDSLEDGPIDGYDY